MATAIDFKSLLDAVRVQADVMRLLELLLQFCAANEDALERAERNRNLQLLKHEANARFNDRLARADAKHATQLDETVLGELSDLCAALIARVESEPDLARCLVVRSFAEAVDQSHSARAFEFADVDQNQRFWNAESENEHTQRWGEFFALLSNEEQRRRLFASSSPATIIVTVPGRQDNWRSACATLRQQVDVITVEQLRAMSKDLGEREMIVDDTSLAAGLSKRNRKALTIVAREQQLQLVSVTDARAAANVS